MELKDVCMHKKCAVEISPGNVSPMIHVGGCCVMACVGNTLVCPLFLFRIKTCPGSTHSFREEQKRQQLSKTQNNNISSRNAHIRS